MIVVDTSALAAVLFREQPGEACMTAMESNRLLISAATMTEALIVAERRGARPGMDHILKNLDFEVVPVTAATAKQAADAYARWGKTFHRAALNLGDSFAYALAKERDCPLLFIGNDFSQTDVKQALSRR